MKPPRVSLTQKQAQLIAWACAAALDQYEKHLMHDDWESGATRDENNETRRTQRDLIRAIKTMHEARCRAK